MTSTLILGLGGLVLACTLFSTQTSWIRSLCAAALAVGVAALVATHNLELARHMDRVFALKDGRLEPQPTTR